MLTAVRIRRRWKRYLFIGAPILTFAVMLYTGFASDIGTAMLVRMPEIGIMDSAPDYDGPSTLDERIAGADVIARVRLVSVSHGVEHFDYSEGEWAYVRSLEFGFEALEYLKGSGGGELVAVAVDTGASYNTRQGAALLGEDRLGDRDTQWDDREAIVFLLDDAPTLPSTENTDRYGIGIWDLDGQDYFTIASMHHRMWLPAVSEGSASEPSSLFHMRDPSLPKDWGVIGDDWEPAEIALSEMKERIAKLNTPEIVGDGSLEWKQCIYRKYEWERQVRYRTELMGGEYYHGQRDYDIRSGLGAGAEVFTTEWAWVVLEEHGETPSDDFGELLIEGPDKDLFDVKYPGIVTLERPLIKGEYRFYASGRPRELVVCDAYPPEAERRRYERVVRAIAPYWSVYEAFFDPVVIVGPGSGDSGVGADPDNGVLKPSSFTTEHGDNVEISRIEWKEGRVGVEIEPRGWLSGHHVDFIGQDGWLTLRLDFDDAVEDETDGSGALTCGVCDHPWVDGDLLMLRISESRPDHTGATNDSECALAPVVTPTPEAASDTSAAP